VRVSCNVRGLAPVSFTGRAPGPRRSSLASAWQTAKASRMVIDALRMAWFCRRPQPGLIHHSDRGSQYCSHDFQKELVAYGMLASMSRKGNCWDNAPSESFFNGLKNERVHATREAFYNRVRRRTSTNGLSPVTFYETWLKQQSARQGLTL
jgi:putative transposase